MIIAGFLLAASAGRSSIDGLQVENKPARGSEIKTLRQGVGSAVAIVREAAVAGPAKILHLRMDAHTSVSDRSGQQPVAPFDFDNAEYKTIRQAAERNNCCGDDFLILLAIRKAENGRAGCEFGVKAKGAWKTDLDTQAGWAAATVVMNRRRFNDSVQRTAGSVGEFIDFLGDRYCPREDDSAGNKNFKRNVKWFYKKYRRDSVRRRGQGVNSKLGATAL